MERYRFAGYRIVEFSPEVRRLLREIADVLFAHKQQILDGWLEQQWEAWQPPGLSKADLRVVFGEIMSSMLARLRDGRPELCITDLEKIGARLAASKFPFEALIISIHFYEETYMPLLVTSDAERTQNWLIGMDEFLHAALAAIAGSYFNAYREEMIEEAEVGRLFQEGLLADIPRKVHDLEVAHIYTSASDRARIGGDFLDHFSYGDCSAFTIGDLSGHGLEAAADSVMLRSLFRGFMREAPDLAGAMARLNRVLMAELESGQFATALAIGYDCNGGIDLVSAGHPYPIVCDDLTCSLFQCGGMALAVDSEATYETDHVELSPGGVLVAYTDGLTEARQSSELFGDERVLETVRSFHDAPARAIADELVDRALRHAGGKFKDDVAVLVLKRTGD